MKSIEAAILFSCPAALFRTGGKKAEEHGTEPRTLLAFFLSFFIHGKALRPWRGWTSGGYRWVLRLRAHPVNLHSGLGGSVNAAGLKPELDQSRSVPTRYPYQIYRYESTWCLRWSVVICVLAQRWGPLPLTVLWTSDPGGGTSDYLTYASTTNPHMISIEPVDRYIITHSKDISSLLDIS